jgi:phospho-N-acetylmuramoyl-pentapeptide-transferase
VVALLLAAGMAVGASLVGTKLLIDWLIARKLGQPIHEDVPAGHTVKAGTPTMGGVAIVGSAVVGYLAAHVRSGLVFTRTGGLVMLCIVGAGAVGMVDDWVKVSNERNLGLTKRAKTAGLLIVAIGFAVATVQLTDVETTLSFTRWNVPGWEVGTVGWCIWAVLLIYASSNGVNLTDGLDGLAAGSAIFVFTSLMVIGFWGFRHPDTYQINHALDLAVVGAAMVGTPRQPGSSWVTPARSRSEPVSPRWCSR